MRRPIIHLRPLVTLRGPLWIAVLLCFLALPASAANISFNVSMSEAVTVTGSPRIAIDLGGATRYATYASGSGTPSLTFSYAVQAGDFDPDGISIDTPQIDLNGAVITDLAGNPLSSFSFTAPNTSGLKVQTYTVAFTSTADLSATSFTISKAPVGVPFTYSISSSGGGPSVTGSGTTSAITHTVPGVNVSDLPTGTLTLSVTLSRSSVAGAARTATVTPGFAGALDSLPASTAAYSVRRLRAAYTGPLLRVRRSSDNAEQDIGYTIGGHLDRAALTAFCGSLSCFVRTWFDQSGNGRDAIQTTAANQPRIVNAGTIETMSNRSSLRFLAASSASLSLTSSPLNGLSATHINVVGMYPADQGWARLFDLGGYYNYMNSIVGMGGRFRITLTGGTGEQGPIPAAAWWTANQPFVAGFEHSGSSMTIWRNGTQVQTAAGITLLPSSVVGSNNYIGKSQYDWDPYPNMNLNEFIILSTASAAARQSLESSQSSYYGIGLQ